MSDHLNGATRLFPIIGDPIKYVESPQRLTRTFGERGYNGICVPVQVPTDDLDAVMADSRPRRTWTGSSSRCRTSSRPSPTAPRAPSGPGGWGS